MISKTARKVAATWAFRIASEGWQPAIPDWAHKWASSQIEAYAPSADFTQALDEARTSVNIMLPKLLQMLHQKQGERYYMSASESRGKVFYYFAPRHPVDSFSLMLAITPGAEASLAFGYMPTKVNGSPDFANGKQNKAKSDPELAGLQLMRLVRALLAQV